jgi:ribose 5-phosphate isomerase B
MTWAGRIIIGTDHGGFELKEILKAYLTGQGVQVTDVGTDSDQPVDYPEIGMEVAQRVSSGEFDKGILLCGSGVGMTIVANKFPCVRAALCLDEETACLSRRHNDANILSLAGRKTDAETAKKIVSLWLDTAFEGGRHSRRLLKIRDLEKRICHPDERGLA